MVSGGLALAAETKVDKDAQICARYPVQLKVGGKLSEYMGQRIRRPSVFQGLTKKEAKKGIIPEGYFITKEDGIKNQRLTSVTKKTKEEHSSKAEDRRLHMSKTPSALHKTTHK
eukprot:3006132-Heterocapsa_arctica.AAC.1